jgi:4-hydroxy-tetrahydrodipicolinate reductase
MKSVRVLVSGCAGRMGRAVIREVLRAPVLTLSGGLERRGGAAIGVDLGRLAGLDPIGVVASADRSAALQAADVVIDFTAPAAGLETGRGAAEAGVALVLGATGWTKDQEAAIAVIADRIPIVKSANFSLGVNLLAALVEQAARRFGEEYDIEISETHHKDKADAPSGTALMLGRSAALGRGADFEAVATAGRTGRRKPGEIGFASLRAGAVVGEHSVMFAAADEILTLSHSARDRSLFARGAVAAARWAVGKPPGLYSMRDVLGA